MRLEPRPYQKEAIAAIKKWHQSGKIGILTQMGTGLGKTSGVVCNLPHYYPEQFEYKGDEGGLLFLSHRREILYHAYEKTRDAYPDKSVAIEMGEYKAIGYEDFIFASIDSLGRLIGNRIDKFNWRYFSVIICDEGHHVTEGGTWDNVLSYFGVGSDREEDFKLGDGRTPLLLFLTATPERDDDKSIAPFLNHCDPDHYGAAYTYSLLDGVQDGWLTDIVAEPVIPSGEIENASEETAAAFVARVVGNKCVGERTLLFAANVEQSAFIADYINQETDLTAAHIYYETDKDLRKEYIEKFESGEIDVLCNRSIFTEGTDLKGLTCIVDNAPTSNKSLFLQKIGRGVRPAADAEVDKYDTAKERRESISKSSKPYLRYIPTFIPSREAMGLVEAFTGIKDEEAIEDGMMIVDEIVDIVQHAEEEQPERELKSVAEAKKIAYREVDYDIWSQTIYNESLRRVSDNRWIEVGGDYMIYLPKNPHSNDKAQDTPVIWRIHDGKLQRILFGGWSEKGKFPVKGKLLSEKPLTKDVMSVIVEADEWLERYHPDIAEEVRVGSLERPPSQRDVNYVKRELDGVAAVKTDRTAKYLKDYARITNKLKKLKL